MKRMPVLAVILLFVVNSYAQFSFTVDPAGENRKTNEERLENFTFVQLKYSDGNWDPNPLSWESIYPFLTGITNIHPEKARRTIELSNMEIFDHPFLIITGDSEFDPFTAGEQEKLKRFFDGGGICFIDDATGILKSGFDKSVRQELKKIFSTQELTKIPLAHSIFYSFHMIPAVVGTRKVADYLEGIEYNNQTTVIYSHNDILGAFVSDKFGNPVKKCTPGGEIQRLEAKKLMVNILMYGLTGTYKLDAIHRNEILNKLKFRNKNLEGE